MSSKKTWANLNDIIRQLLPEDDSDETKLAMAVSEIGTALEEHRTITESAEKLTSKELATLGRALHDVQRCLDNPSISTVEFVANSLDAPLGKLLDPVRQVTAAIREASSPSGRPPKPANVILAYNVARILKEVISIEPALTRISETSTGSQGGAAFNRLLAMVFEVGNIYAPDDLYPLMKKGLELYKNPRGDSQ
jgi:hypothetical protein